MSGIGNILFKTCSRVLSTLALLSLSATSFGENHADQLLINQEQQVDVARWYQVDLVIFSQNTVVEDDPESWPTYPILDQSRARLHLSDPNEDDTADFENTEESTETLNESVEEDLLDEVLPAGPEDLVAFEKLPVSGNKLADYVQKMEADRRFRILFNESWNHPIMPADSALPLMLNGGDNYGNFDELSGLIKIHVSRYLHVETQLYLTDIVESSDPFDLVSGNPDFKYSVQNIDDTGSALSIYEGIELFSAEQLATDVTTLEPGKDYNYQVAVSSAFMQEKRRLRSKELHYIDNPKFGLLIYFTPIEFQAPVELKLDTEVH